MCFQKLQIFIQCIGSGMANSKVSGDLELLAPWNETVKAEIERRANESNQSYVNCQGAPTTGK